MLDVVEGLQGFVELGEIGGEVAGGGGDRGGGDVGELGAGGFDFPIVEGVRDAVEGVQGAT